MTGKADTSKKDEGGLGARGAAGERKKAAAATGEPERPPSAATGEPKRPPSAFAVFRTEFRQEYSAQHHEDNSDLAVTKAAAAKWRDMSEQEKQPFVDQSDQKEYIDEHEPKRPTTAFYLFVTEYRQEYKAQRPIKSELAADTRQKIACQLD